MQVLLDLLNTSTYALRLCSKLAERHAKSSPGNVMVKKWGGGGSEGSIYFSSGGKNVLIKQRWGLMSSGQKV